MDTLLFALVVFIAYLVFALLLHRISTQPPPSWAEWDDAALAESTFEEF